MSKDTERLHLNRRGFIRSLFGLTSAAEANLAAAGKGAANLQSKAEAKAKGKPVIAGEWFWSNIRTGQIGFPAGLTLRQNRPGSVMKLIATAALHNEGLVNANEIVECNGGATVIQTSAGKETVVCQFAHGNVTLAHAIGYSCNVYFATMARRLNGHTFITYATRFGLDQPVAARKSGPFPTQINDHSTAYVLGLAEDLQPTALQLLRVASLVASRGHVPYMHSAEDMAEHPPFELELSEGTWNRLSEGMRFCVLHGTAKGLDPDNKLEIAAKTGSVLHAGKMHSWITGYFPLDNPEHSFCVWSPSGTSHDAAVPFANKVLLGNKWS
jgi:cell division protein FtsI/penicillin-binding protein 2